MNAPAWTCPGCDTHYDPGFPWALDVCEACEEEGRDSSGRVRGSEGDEA